MIHVLLLAGLQATALQAHRNLVINGDFSLGNAGFTSQYTYSRDLTDTGNYSVGPDPHEFHSGGASFGARTGKGNMLAANGAEKPNTALWQQTVKVQPNHHYYFVVWTASWGQGQPNADPSPARLALFANGKALGYAFTLKATDGEWSKFVATWDSGSSKSAQLRIVDENLDGFGNDFAIDDIAFHD